MAGVPSAPVAVACCSLLRKLLARPSRAADSSALVGRIRVAPTAGDGSRGLALGFGGVEPPRCVADPLEGGLAFGKGG